MSSNSLPTGTVSEPDAERTRPVRRTLQSTSTTDPGVRSDAVADGPASAAATTTAEAAELRATVAALERELDRREAEKRELVDRYERLLATERRGGGTSRAEGERAAGSGLVGRVVGAVGKLVGR